MTRPFCLLVFLAAGLVGCSGSEAPATDITAAIPDAKGQTPPPMPSGMGQNGRTSGPAPEDSTKAGG